MTEAPPWWERGQGRVLKQGDYLPRVFVAIPPVSFPSDTQENTDEVPYVQEDLIVLTQSCDLIGQAGRDPRAVFVTLCPVYSVEAYEAAQSWFRSKDGKNSALAGRREGIYVLASPIDPKANRGALIVDFYQVFSLPRVALEDYTGSLGTRWRLLSPYLEHLSQAFGHFFMRVGLPDGSDIPKFE